MLFPALAAKCSALKPNYQSKRISLHATGMLEKSTSSVSTSCRSRPARIQDSVTHGMAENKHTIIRRLKRYRGVSLPAPRIVSAIKEKTETMLRSCCKEQHVRNLMTNSQQIALLEWKKRFDPALPVQDESSLRLKKRQKMSQAEWLTKWKATPETQTGVYKANGTRDPRLDAWLSKYSGNPTLTSAVNGAKWTHTHPGDARRAWLAQYSDGTIHDTVKGQTKQGTSDGMASRREAWFAKYNTPKSVPEDSGYPFTPLTDPSRDRHRPFAYHNPEEQWRLKFA